MKATATEHQILTLADLYFLMRFGKNGQAERIVSAKTLKAELDAINEDADFFNRFLDRAYREMKDEYTCKLRSGVKVTFVLR